MSNPETPWWHKALSHKENDGLLRVRNSFQSLSGGWCERIANQACLKLRDFASNDYLGLAHHPRLVQAVKSAVEQHGTGSKASALISGRSPAHTNLEQELCRFENTDAAILFPSGYAANMGAISALIGTEDIVFCDRLNHSCLVEGCKLSGAKMKIFHHDRLEQLESHLKKASAYRDRWIVTDAVFSMEGDLAPLPAICDLAEQYAAKIFIDEAHGTGVYGATGRGVAEHHEVLDRVTVRVGTLSKALASQGGFVVGDQKLIDWLWNSAKTQMFSTALSPASCAAATEAIRIITEEPERRQQLAKNARKMRKTLTQNNLSPLGESQSPIVPVLLNDPLLAVAVAQKLRESGFHVAAIRPPTVPKGTSRLRITISTHHQEDEIFRLAELVAKAVSN